MCVYFEQIRLGQLTQQSVDGQASVLYAYDTMGNVCRQTVLLDAAAPEDATRNRILTRTVTADGDVEQPIQWSSEYSDSEIGLIMFLFRHYNTKAGYWIVRDFIDEKKVGNLFSYVKNAPNTYFDVLGLTLIDDREYCRRKSVGIKDFIDWLFLEKKCCPCDPTPKGVGIVFANGGDAEMAQFTKYASANGRWLFISQTGKDFLNALETVTAEKCGNCISNLTIAGHGHGMGDYSPRNGCPGADMLADEGFYYDKSRWENFTRNSADIENLANKISRGKITFCSPCLIQIYSCRKGRRFASKLAMTTGCRVVYASGACSPSKVNDNNWNSGPGDWEERNENGGRYMGFMEALPDGTIGELRSSKTSKRESVYIPE